MEKSREIRCDKYSQRNMSSFHTCNIHADSIRSILNNKMHFFHGRCRLIVNHTQSQSAMKVMNQKLRIIFFNLHIQSSYWLCTRVRRAESQPSQEA